MTTLGSKTASGIVAALESAHQTDIATNVSRNRYVLVCSCGFEDQFLFYGQAQEAAEIHKAVKQ